MGVYSRGGVDCTKWAFACGLIRGGLNGVEGLNRGLMLMVVFYKI